MFGAGVRFTQRINEKCGCYQILVGGGRPQEKGLLRKPNYERSTVLKYIFQKCGIKVWLCIITCGVWVNHLTAGFGCSRYRHVASNNTIISNCELERMCMVRCVRYLLVC
jgi:hypothetical protein